MQVLGFQYFAYDRRYPQQLIPKESMFYGDSVEKTVREYLPEAYLGARTSLLVVRTEVQAGRVHAIPQSGRRRTVFKHVPQMSVALSAANLGPNHAVGRIFMLDDIAGLAGLRKTWPAGPRIELGLRIKQWGAAAYAVIHSRFFGIPVLAGKRALGSGFARHVILLVAKLLLPRGFGFQDFFCHQFTPRSLFISIKIGCSARQKVADRGRVYFSTSSPALQYFPR